MKCRIISAVLVVLLIIFCGIYVNALKDTVTPCLMYHSISEEPLFDKAYPEMSVKPSDFEKQMKYISEKGYITLFADEFARNEKNIVITFDDGYEDNYYNVFPVLKKYNIKATIFIITEKIGLDGFLKQEQIKEMSDSGLVRFGSHTVSHRNITELPYSAVNMEFKISKTVTENITGKKVNSVSYPYGYTNEEICSIAEQYYDYHYTDAGFEDNTDIKDIHRIGIYRSQTFSDFENLISNRKLYQIKRHIKKLLRIPIPWEEY